MDATLDFTSTPTPELIQSITRLSADINAATFVQLMMIAELDARQGCGVSLGAAREKVRVANALQDLPQTREAFASGELSFSKARAITRIGTVDNEECLLSFARYGTASQLDRTVRLYRKQYEGSNALMAGYHQRVLPADESADDDVDPAEAERQGAMHHRAHRQLDTRWDEFGCLEIRARLTAEEGAVVLKALEAAVESLKEDERQTESAAEVEQNPSAEGCAATVHQHRRADALVLMANQSLESASTNANTADRFQVVVHVDSQVLAGDVHTKPTGEPDCYIEKEVAIPVETARRLSCSCKVVTALTKGSEPLSIGRSSRAISTAISRALTIRDGQCQFPGCDCNRHLDAHHIVHWAEGGETSLDNLIEVCHFHHVQMHEAGYSAHRLKTGELQFYKPDGTLLIATPEPIISGDPLQKCKTEPWSWCGDSMDYSMALHCIASMTSVMD